MDTKQIILDKAEKPALESKKMLAALIGVGIVMIVWLGTIVCMVLRTDIASHLVSLATIVVSFIGTIITALITGQSAMEWKSMSTVAQVDTNDKEEKISQETQNINVKEEYTEHVIDEEDTNSPRLKPFGQQAIR